ncbi:hypothetical protein Tco_0200649 [Tanacetum coccineum]
MVSILPLPGLFSCERDGRGFHCFSKLCGLFMVKIPQLLKRIRIVSYAEEGKDTKGLEGLDLEEDLP